MVRFAILAIEDESSDEMASTFIRELESICDDKFNLIQDNVTLQTFKTMINTVLEKIKNQSEDNITKNYIAYQVNSTF